MHRTVEHLDVLIVGAGLSGIGAGALPPDRVPVGQLRHLRGARRHRRHVGPVPLPGHPVRLRHVHPRLLVPAVGRREVDRRRRVDPAVHPATPRPRRASTSTSASTTASSRADWSTDEARWHVTAERTDTGETVELTCGFLFSCSGYYRYDQGYQPDFAGMDRFAGHDRAPAGLARGPRLRRQAGRGDRQRRHRRHAHPVAGRRRPRTSRCCSGRRPTSRRCRPRTRVAHAAAPGAARRASSGPAIRWCIALGTQALLPAQPAPARRS